jgi:hypothetical protein
MLTKPESRELKNFDYSAHIKVDIICPQTGKQLVKDFKVHYYAGSIEPDEIMLINKIFKKALHERNVIKK